MHSIKYSFEANVWKHDSDGGWHFVSLPEDISSDIRMHLKHFEEGWGRLKAKALLKESTWDTAIWFDTKRNTYLLPIKANIRRKFNVKAGDQLNLTITV